MTVYVTLTYTNQEVRAPQELSYFGFDDFRYEDILELGLDSFPPGQDISNLTEIRLWATA
jgi:hypothetical protein